MSITDLPSSAPVRKVVAAAGGAGIGSAVAAFVVGMLDDHVYAPGVPDSVPGYVTGLIVVTVPSLVAYAAGWWTRRGVEELAPPGRPGDHVRLHIDDRTAADIEKALTRLRQKRGRT